MKIRRANLAQLGRDSTLCISCPFFFFLVVSWQVGSVSRCSYGSSFVCVHSKFQVSIVLYVQSLFEDLLPVCLSSCPGVSQACQSFLLSHAASLAYRLKMIFSETRLSSSPERESLEERSVPARVLARVPSLIVKPPGREGYTCLPSCPTAHMHASQQKNI